MHLSGPPRTAPTRQLCGCHSFVSTILSVAKNQVVGVSVGATESATPGSILRRKILRYAQNDRSRLTSGSGQEYTNTFTTDGKVNPITFAGLAAKGAASWLDNNLVVKAKFTLDGYDVIVQTTYILSPDRMTLTQNSHIKTPTVETEQKLVFERH